MKKVNKESRNTYAKLMHKYIMWLAVVEADVNRFAMNMFAKETKKVIWFNRVTRVPF